MFVVFYVCVCVRVCGILFMCIDICQQDLKYIAFLRQYKGKMLLIIEFLFVCEYSQITILTKHAGGHSEQPTYQATNTHALPFQRHVWK